MNKYLASSIIKEIDYGYISYGNLHSNDDEGLKLIADALKKQIPKKPILEADGYADGELVYDTWYCPNCDKSYEVDYDSYDFCPNCGQAIDWSDEDDI